MPAVGTDRHDAFVEDEPGLHVELAWLGHLGTVAAAGRRQTGPIEPLGLELDLNTRRAAAADDLAQIDGLPCLDSRHQVAVKQSLPPRAPVTKASA